MQALSAGHAHQVPRQKGLLAGNITTDTETDSSKMAGRVVSTKATKFFTYSRTAKSNTEYATKMKRLSNQIFGEVGLLEESR